MILNCVLFGEYATCGDKDAVVIELSIGLLLTLLFELVGVLNKFVGGNAIGIADVIEAVDMLLELTEVVGFAFANRERFVPLLEAIVAAAF